MALQDAHLKTSKALSARTATSAFDGTSDLVSKCQDAYETLSVVVENLDSLVQFLDYASKVILHQS